jgi:hypothetical protein
MKPIQPSEIYEPVRACFDFDKQQVIQDDPTVHGYRGARTCIWFVCSQCQAAKWVERQTAISKITPYCTPCSKKHIRSYANKFLLTPEMIPEVARSSFDYSKQERHMVGNGHTTALYIWATCPACNAARWVVAYSARRRITPYCSHCIKTKTCRGKEKGDGWFITPDGYKVIDTERFYPDHKDYIRAHLSVSSNPNSYWYVEHRVIALLHFGSWATEDGLVIRHLNGNKLDNAPSNLLPGTDQDNKLDHHQAVQLMQAWRHTALTLIAMLRTK